MNKYDKRSAKELKIPYAYQQKAVLRFLKVRYAGKERYSALAVYCAITWIASDFSKENSIKTVKNWPKTISTYSGIGKGTASKFIKQFAELGIIRYGHVKNPISGKWHNWIVELPAHLPQEVLERGLDAPVSGQAVAGEADTL